MRGDDSKHAANRRHFDRWAKRYESDGVSRRLAALQHTALAGLSLGPTDRLIDVGCGTGAAVRAAAAVAERAVGIDLSAAMVERGRELAGELPNVELLEADAETIPFADGSFTAALCTTSLHHYPDPERAVAEIARVLSGGGRVAIADAITDRRIVWLADRILRRVQRSHVGMRSAAQLEALLLDAGFERPRTSLLEHGVWAVVTARLPRSPGSPADGSRG
jgi:ubiquinone/menaquinone biosynthesis C-methylase UbiE